MAKVALAAVVAVVVPSHALDNGVARTPPMGWATWNGFHRHWNEQNFYDTVDVFLSNGMKETGYEYLNVDGGWWALDEKGAIVRNATGHVTYSRDKYPRGLPALVDYIHSRGFKYGHYSDAGKAACDGDAPMSEGYEEQDVAVFVHEWKADMLKLDACNTEEDPKVLVQRWHDLLNATGRPVLFSNCHNGCQTSDGDLAPWCGELSNMWRTHGDIKGTWKNVLKNVDSLKGRGGYARPGAWNDPDFLEVNLGELLFNGSQVSLDMNRAHFAMWAVTSSPLFASNDFSKAIPKEIIDLYNDKEVVAIDQEYAGHGGDFIRELAPSLSVTFPPQGVELWAKPLPSGRVAVAVFNRGLVPVQPVSFALSELPGLTDFAECNVRDVWAKKVLAPAQGNYTTGELRARSTELLIFSGCSKSWQV